MEERKALSLLRKAIEDYSMIQEGDKIAVGISGGKDSLTLLYLLSHLKKFYPADFELYGVTIDLGFNNLDLSGIKDFCTSLNVPYYIVSTQIADIVFNDRKETNPCALCSKMRKGAMNNFLLEKGINKLAYAHHMDDVIDTFFLSLIYEGRMHTFSPVTNLSKTGITVIRPLIYVNESEVKGFINKYDIPVVKSPCPMDKHTKREYVKELISEINKENPGVKKRIFTAIKSSNLDGFIQ